MSDVKSKSTEYNAPKLVKYGDMAKLTAAGSLNTSEPTSGPGSTDPTKKK